MEGISEEAPERSPAVLLGHPLRVHILSACDQREMTPKEFALETKQPLANINYHFRELLEAKFLYETRREKAGGAERVFYRARRQGVVSDDEFAEMPFKKRRLLTVATLKDLFRRAVAASWAGTIDRRTDSHVTWDASDLDPRGYKDAMGILMVTFESLDRVKEESADRLKDSDEERIYTTWGLLGFESPPRNKKKFKAGFPKRSRRPR